MGTGACGINCDVCGLNVQGICSTCGPAKSRDAQKKIATQKRILGAPCPILACVVNNHVDYCLRDCNRFRCDKFDGFKKAAEGLGGEALKLADAAYKFLAFPKVPLYYLFWEGDNEFGPRLSILFDRSIELHLAADAIWGLTNLVSDILLMDAAR